MRSTRTRLAYALAPALPAPAFLVWLSAANSTFPGRVEVFFVLLFALPVSYLSCLLFGLPLIPYFRRKRRLNLINLTIGGAILGMIVFYVFGFGFAAFIESSRSLAPTVVELIWGAGLGVLVALPFGLIAGYPLTGTANGSE